MAWPHLGDLEAADEGDYLPADVALVGLEGSRADPSGPLVLDPAAQVRGQPDAPGEGSASSFHEADELAERALRLLLRGEAALTLLSSLAADGMGADVDDESPRCGACERVPAWTASFGGLMRNS